MNQPSLFGEPEPEVTPFAPAEPEAEEESAASGEPFSEEGTEYCNSFLCDLNGEKPSRPQLRVTPEGQPTVADLLPPGTIIRTSYKSGPYIVRTCSAHRYYGTFVAYSVTCMYFEQSRRRKREDDGIINELVAEDGRIRKLFNANDDEVYILTAEQAQQYIDEEKAERERLSQESAAQFAKEYIEKRKGTLFSEEDEEPEECDQETSDPEETEDEPEDEEPSLF